MFKGINAENFRSYFDDEEKCKNYLLRLKFRNGFCCRKCDCKKSGKGHTSFHVRCLNCNYEESPTSNTLFHKLKIPLSKAFGIVFRMAVPSRGTSALDLAREFSINPNTAGRFARKIRLVMVSMTGDDNKIQFCQSKIIDSIIVLNREKELNGLQQIGISLSKSKVQDLPIDQITTAICDLPERLQKNNCELLRGKFIKEKKDISLWNFKTWLSGSHHRCSLQHLQGYLNQFYFKLDYRGKKSLIWHMVIENAVRAKPAPYLKLGPN